MTPGDPRWWRISKGQEALTPDDLAAGWHVCQDFDLDLVGPEALDENGRCSWCHTRPDERSP
jgi:hypothetical protein